jgi:DNA-binding CsgD family transcriptional regulator/PAS domain-containing protein
MPTGPNHPDFEEILGLIYQGPIEPVPWHAFLDRFRDIMDAMTVGLILRPPSEGDKGLLLDESDIEARWRTAYRDRYFALDPFVDLPLGQPVTLQELVPVEELVRREFYTQYMKPMGALYALAVDVREPGGLEARLRAARPLGAVDFGEEEKALCKRLVPHLERALQIHGRLRCVESERDLYADTVDQFAVGTILLDEAGRVLQTNQVAEGLLRERDGLALRHGRLQVSDGRDSQLLQQRIDTALAAQRARVPRVAEALRIERPSEKRDIALLIRPVPVGQWSDGRACPAVAVFIAQPEDHAAVSPEVLGHLFGLTKAEASVASLIAGGQSVEETARALGTSVHTARAHLRSIFSKTGVTRQTELVLLILRSAANLG